MAKFRPLGQGFKTGQIWQAPPHEVRVVQLGNEGLGEVPHSHDDKVEVLTVFCQAGREITGCAVTAHGLGEAHPNLNHVYNIC